MTEGGVELTRADDYKGMWNYACCEKLLAGRPKNASSISIGPAGELMLKSASVACTDRDKERRPARHAARGGIGAVMGAKCLKWVVIEPGKARLRQAADAKAFAANNKVFSKTYLSDGRHDIFKGGTSTGVPLANMLHTFPYKNRTEGRNPEVDKLDGARIHEEFPKRGGGMHNCMNGCIVRCFQHHPRRGGQLCHFRLGVRDPDFVGLLLRHQQLGRCGGPGPALRRAGG